MTSSTVCGYLVITNLWFDDDDGDPETRSFWLQAKDGEVVYDKSIREAWEKAICPQYVNMNYTSMFSYFDLKTNPRRIHPFATVFEDWFCREIYSYINGTQKVIPVLILRPCRVSLVGHWRHGLSSSMLLEARKHVTRSHAAFLAAKTIQVWWHKRK